MSETIATWPSIESITVRIPSQSVNENSKVILLTLDEARKLRDELNKLFGASQPAPYSPWPPYWTPPPVTIPAEPYKIGWGTPIVTCDSEAKPCTP